MAISLGGRRMRPILVSLLLFVLSATVIVSSVRVLMQRPHHLFDIRYADTGAFVHDASRLASGITLLTTYWPESNWKPGVRLIGPEGGQLHHWEIDPSELWEESPYDDYVANSKNVISNYVHGTYLFENGDLLFNVEYLGLARVNSCGDVLWKLPYRTHHSVFRSEDGNFWVSAMKWVEGKQGAEGLFPGLSVPFSEDIALQVSPDGRILNEISILDALYRSPYKYVIYRYGVEVNGDFLHVNDVEELSDALAAKFPGFEAGDLLVSARNIDSVFVMGIDGEIKWLNSDFLRQHDPDFAADGTISIFNNRDDGSDVGSWLSGSQIVKIDPVTGNRRQIYPLDPAQNFYTSAGGKHQRLANGNYLITEARAGRVFEVSPDGKVVWEWFHEPYDDESVAEVLEATRYDIDQTKIAEWPCSQQ
jgi:hypothetical protein